MSIDDAEPANGAPGRNAGQGCGAEDAPAGIGRDPQALRRSPDDDPAATGRLGHRS